MSRLALLALSLLCLELCACGVGSTFEAAGAGELVSLFAVEPPQAPAPPAPPVFLPCPHGWSVRAGTVSVCQPYPNDVPAKCAADEAHFVGEAGCTRVGTACPSGEWADSFAQDRPVLFVSATAPSGSGDGSREAPFATIEQATAQAQSGTIIALGKGTHFADGYLPAGVTILGACVAQTVVSRRETAAKRIELYTTAAGVEVRNLTISGSGVGLQVQGPTGSVHVEDVIISGAHSYGCTLAAGAHATAHTLVIRDTGPLVNGGRGAGLTVSGGSRLEGSRVVVQGSLQGGVIGSDTGTMVQLSDTAVLDTSPDDTTHIGRGVQVQNGARLELSRSFVAQHRDEGVLSSLGAAVQLTDVVVRDIAPGAAGTFGAGVSALQGTVKGARVRVEHATHAGITATQGGSISLTDVYVAGTQLDDVNCGLGVFSRSGSSITIERGFVTDSRSAGVESTAANSSMTLIDVDISDTHASPPTPLYPLGDGAGLRCGVGATLSLTRVRNVRSQGFGIEVGQLGTTVVATDLTMLATQPGIYGEGTAAIGVFDGAQVSVTRAAVAQNTGSGAHVQGPGARLVITDLSVNGGGDVGPGIGITAGIGGTVFGARVAVVSAKGSGVAAIKDSSMTLSDVLVTQTRADCRGADSCPQSVPMGALSAVNSSLRLERFLVTDNRGIGVVQHGGSQLDLAHGEISFQAIGANVIDPGYDVQRLNDDVAYRGNQQKLASQDVPLPSFSLAPAP